jgi:IS30 family transposase
VFNIIKLHHESIYRYLLKNKASGGLLYKHLRHQGKPYRKRYGHPNNRTSIPNRIDIVSWSRIQFIHSYFNLIAGNIYQRHRLWEVLP